jgi:hypothetical protein
MGGHALKNTYIERKNTEEFLRIGKEIQDKILSDLFLETVILKCYRTKTDHGDLDLLIKITPNLNINWKTYIQITFNPNEIFNNGGVYSFDYQNFQIDFIPIKEKSWNIAQTYGFFDPLSNIMGKTFHKFGLSYGWDGLFYKYRNAHGTNSENILLTTDPKKIFDFGGYDYDRYLKGFETLEDIFKFVIDSANFNTEMFQMENLKSIDKKRNRKRGSYHLFLKYLKDNKIYVRKDFEEDKTKYIIAIDFYFPEVKLLDKLNELRKKDAQDKALSEKFNGNIIMQWLPELKGKELGEAITIFKNQWGEHYNDYIAKTSIDDIHDCFMLVYNSFHRGKK